MLGGFLFAVFVVVLFILFFARIFLCITSWHQTHNPPSSASCLCLQVLELQACSTTPSLE
jgi:hypothetical protein